MSCHGYRGQVDSSADHVERASFYFFEDSAYVFAEDADAEEDAAADEAEENDDRSPARNSTVFETSEDGISAVADAEERHEHACNEAHAQRHRRKGDGCGPGEGDHFSQGVIGFSSAARGALEFDGGLGEADPRDHSAHEAVCFAHGFERVEAGARDEAEIAHVSGEIGVDQRFHGAVEGPGGEAFEAGFAFAGDAATIDYVVTFTIFFDHLGDDFGGILQVGVDDDDGVAACFVEAGGDGSLVPKVSGHADDFDAGIEISPGKKEFEAVIGATVVNEDHFGFAAQFSKHQPETIAQGREGRFLVVDGNDDGKKSRRRTRNEDVMRGGHFGNGADFNHFEADMRRTIKLI